MDPSQRLAATLAVNPSNIACDSSAGDEADSCPCGSHCTIDDHCFVECVTGTSPPLGYACASGKTCSPSGRCVPAATGGNGSPPLQVSLEISPAVVSANTATASSVVPVSIVVKLNSLDFLQAQPGVRFHIAGFDDNGFDPPPPGPAPLVQCASAATPTPSCNLDGGWVFDIHGSSLESQPRTIWVQIPRVSTAMRWTLVAISDSAQNPATTQVSAQPLIVPATDPGHYTGTITWPNASATAPLSLPVEAVVTSGDVALFEPATVLLPDAHVVLARDGSRSTMLGWLSATVGNTASRYSVRLSLGTLTYDNTTGHLAGNVSMTTGPGVQTTLALSLDRTGDANAPSCMSTSSCTGGTYCEPAMNVCLPGTAPAAGAGIVSNTDPAATPTTTLPSPLLATWQPVATTLASNPLLAGTGLTGMSRAYCYHSGEGLPAQFGTSRTMVAGDPSQDFGCVPGTVQGGTAYAETTFPYVASAFEITLDPSNSTTETFNLLDACRNDLEVTPPTDSTTLANTVDISRQCASVAQFFTALNASAASATVQPETRAQMRMSTQLLRQWLGVHAYVANATVQNRSFDDALGRVNQPADVRLGQSADLVENGLRVLLDPTVRREFTADTNAPIVAVDPDYRTQTRPVVHWSFNNMTGSPVLDTERREPFIATGVDLSTYGGIFTANPSGDATCHSTSPIAVDNDRFTIAFAFGGHIHNGPVTVFQKTAADGTTISLDATESFSTSPVQFTFVLRDSAGQSASFTLPFGDVGVGWGFLAFTADNGTYSLLRAEHGQVQTFAATNVVGGGPRWGGAGPVSLACNTPVFCQYATCTSWDYAPHEGNNWAFQSSIEVPWSWSRTCTTRARRTTCSGSVATQADCNATAAARQSQILPGLMVGYPPNVPALISVQGFLSSNHDVQDSDTGVTTTDSGTCRLSLSIPTPQSGAAPACGCSATSPPWVMNCSGAPEDSCMSPILQNPSQSGLFYDELSLWSRPLDAEDVLAIAGSYDAGRSNVDVLPPLDPTVFSPNDEQGAGLAAHLVETASSDMNLLVAYLDAARGAAYGQCYQGGRSDARDAALDRAGRHLRLVAVLENEAASLVASPGATTAPWYPRYLANLTSLAANRGRVLEQLQLLRGCKNPLGIAEEEVPLFIGDAGPSSAAEFYAGSRFLVDKAKQQINSVITADLPNARSAYNAQVQNDFSVNLVTDQTGIRATTINKLLLTYETQARRYCGAIAGHEDIADHAMIDALMAGRLDAKNCFLRTERAECQRLASAPADKIPTSCLRGEIGERIAALQGAIIDSANAQSASNRASQLFDSDTHYCAERKIDGQSNTALLSQHLVTMQTINDQMANNSFLVGALLDIGAILVGAPGDGQTGGEGQTGGRGSLQLPNLVGTIDTIVNSDLQSEASAEQNSYQIEVAKREVDQEAKDCYLKANNDKLAIDAANDAVARAAQQGASAALSVQDASDALRALATEAAGETQLEGQLNRTPPHLHFWLDDAIRVYDADMAIARRLTYLAMRAYEYESQTTTDLRSTILTARQPSDLLAIINTIDGQTAPLSGVDGHVPVTVPEVLSVRDEILRVPDLTNSLHLPPGTPKLSAADAFARYMASDSSKIYDRASGQYLGHGIRFTLSPGEWAESMCAERMWRIVPQVADNISTPQPDHSDVVLMQENSFGSQKCEASQTCVQDADCASGACNADHTCVPVVGLLQTTRFQPTSNLITGTGPIQFQTPLDFTSMQVSLAPSTVNSRQALKDLPLGGGSSFAGRGLYGDYILLFPKWTTSQCAKDTQGHLNQCPGWTEEAVASLQDVLIRFEIVNATVQRQPQQGVAVGDGPGGPAAGGGTN